MNTLDILVNCSITPEPFGLTVVEGMALKKPIVAFNEGGPAEQIVDSNTGKLSPPGNLEHMANNISLLLDNDNERQSFGEAGYRRYLQHFTNSSHVNNILRIYETILK